jgi:hypothetical protein
MEKIKLVGLLGVTAIGITLSGFIVGLAEIIADQQRIIDMLARENDLIMDHMLELEDRIIVIEEAISAGVL